MLNVSLIFSLFFVAFTQTDEWWVPFHLDLTELIQENPRQWRWRVPCSKTLITFPQIMFYPEISVVWISCFRIETLASITANSLGLQTSGFRPSPCALYAWWHEYPRAVLISDDEYNSHDRIDYTIICIISKCRWCWYFIGKICKIFSQIWLYELYFLTVNYNYL